ncbi:unnamed protein product [Caenorhabditis nigoni]
MSVPTFDAFAYGITNSDRIGKDELAKLEATKFSKIKDMEINMKSIIQILVVIENLENELNVTTSKFFRIPDQGYHGRDPLPDDLSQFKKKKSEFETSSVSLTKNLRIPIRFPAMIQLVLLDNIDSFNSRETILSHLKFRFMGGHFAIDDERKINAVLDADYTAHYGNEFRLCSKNLGQVRVDLNKACEETAKNLDFYDTSDKKEMKQCVKLYYDVGFGNLAKWEVAVNILKDLFDSKNAMDSPVNSTRDVAATWNSHHSLDLNSGGNSVSNSPMNLNSVPSKSYLPAHMTRQKRNLFVKSYSTGQMFNRHLNRKATLKNSIVGSNSDSSSGSNFMNLNQNSGSSSQSNFHPPVGLSPPSNVDPVSPAYMQSTPSLSVEPQIPVMYLKPKNSDAPVYGLVPDGLAPEGWQSDPAWQQNVYEVGGTIEYKGNDYQMATTFTEL